MAENIGNGADGLAGQLPGTVYDIGWAPGADTHRDPPWVIMVAMDKYTGPSYLITDAPFEWASLCYEKLPGGK
ncbi:hypothetical protein CEP54_015791 [Fusarium duplospermum]|uniref:Uncharacterized protein n=1 Tax=Fusarium duplospermum TaxID=1325734 RepID=A0A428NL72_9HYPO|nr:hypothetical protein CEP54_015791 [Fusarium duplospermum]